jgi:hypothetical protein
LRLEQSRLLAGGIVLSLACACGPVVHKRYATRALAEKDGVSKKAGHCLYLMWTRREPAAARD